METETTHTHTTSTPTARAATGIFGGGASTFGEDGTFGGDATTPTTTGGWMREKEAAAYIGCGLDHLRRLKRDGLPYHLVAGSPRAALYLVSEIEEWWGNQRRVPRTYPRPPRQPRYRLRDTAADA